MLRIRGCDYALSMRGNQIGVYVMLCSVYAEKTKAGGYINYPATGDQTQSGRILPAQGVARSAVGFINSSQARFNQDTFGAGFSIGCQTFTGLTSTGGGNNLAVRIAS